MKRHGLTSVMVCLVTLGGLGLGCESEEAPAGHCRGEPPAFIFDAALDAALAGALSVVCQRGGEPVEDIYPCRVPGTGTTEFRNAYFTRVTMDDLLRVDIRQTDGYVGRAISVEIRSEEALGRVCLLCITDEVGEPCGSREYPTADCAETGVLSITRLPSPTDPDVTDIHVAGEVRFADGLEIAFSVPLVDSP